MNNYNYIKYDDDFISLLRSKNIYCNNIHHNGYSYNNNQLVFNFNNEFINIFKSNYNFNFESKYKLSDFIFINNINVIISGYCSGQFIDLPPFIKNINLLKPRNNLFSVIRKKYLFLIPDKHFISLFNIKSLWLNAIVEFYYDLLPLLYRWWHQLYSEYLYEKKLIVLIV